MFHNDSNYEIIWSRAHSFGIEIARKLYELGCVPRELPASARPEIRAFFGLAQAQALAPIEFTEQTIARESTIAIAPDAVCNAFTKLSRVRGRNTLFAIRQFTIAGIIAPSEHVLARWFASRHIDLATLTAYADYVSARKGKQCVDHALQRALPKMFAKGLYQKIAALCASASILRAPAPVNCDSLLELGSIPKREPLELIRALALESIPDWNAAIHQSARLNVPLNWLRKLLKRCPREYIAPKFKDDEAVYLCDLQVDIIQRARALNPQNNSAYRCKF